MMSEFDFTKKLKVIPVGERLIVKVGKGAKCRYMVYLPIELNYVWEVLHREKKKVRVWLEVV